MTADPLWQPTTFRRYVRTVASSSRVALIRTDAGPAYLKAINNPEGPHILACDWLGTHLARRFGLQTFDIALLELTELDEIPITENTLAQPGPAFVARGERGSSMGGQRALTNVENVEDIPRIVVFDTWMRHCDRYGPGQGREGGPRVNLDNLFLSEDGAPEGKFILKPIDHGHILTCGKPLTHGLANIDATQDDRLYGLFPFFRPYVSIEQIDSVIPTLEGVSSDFWADILKSLPAAWGVPDEVKTTIDRFLLARARFLADNLHAIMHRELSPDALDFGNETEVQDE